jgi:hypothetical protein
LRHARDRGGEVVVRDGLAVDLDSLGERAQVRRRVGADVESVLAQDARGEAHGRRLAVRPDDVDRREAALRHAEHRHQLVHAVEPEPHAEQLQVEQVLLGLPDVHEASPESRSSSAW